MATHNKAFASSVADERTSTSNHFSSSVNRLDLALNRRNFFATHLVVAAALWCYKNFVSLMC